MFEKGIGRNDTMLFLREAARVSMELKEGCIGREVLSGSRFYKGALLFL